MNIKGKFLEEKLSEEDNQYLKIKQGCRNKSCG